MHGPDGRDYVRRRSGEAFHPDCLRSTVKYPAGQMVWGCFSYFGVGHLYFNDCTFKAKKYIDILKHNLLPTIRNQFDGPENCLFQDDCTVSQGQDSKSKVIFSVFILFRLTQKYKKIIQNINSSIFFILDKKILDEENIRTLDWPGNNPDLNPVENYWSEMAKKLAAKGPEPKMNCRDSSLIHGTKKISVEYVQKLVNSMPRRVQAVIKKRRPTKY